MAATTFQMQLTDASARQILAEALKTLRAGAIGPMRVEFRQAAARYLAFIRTRFVRASRGDGTWLPLARSTKRKKLEKIAPGRLAALIKQTGRASRVEAISALLDSRPFPILRDTNTLFGSLTEGAPGNQLDYRQDGVQVSSNVFYGIFHQDPPIPGRPPQRLIFVEPDPPTEAVIQQTLALGVLNAFLESHGA